VLYEDRVAQGILPACWACLPKVETEGDAIVAEQIRNLTRKMVEMKWGMKESRKIWRPKTRLGGMNTKPV
jgi:hypothetical protein